MAKEEWLQTGAAAELLGVSKKTLLKWAEADLVRHQVLPGGYRRFRRADLEEFQRKTMRTARGEA